MDAKYVMEAVVPPVITRVPKIHEEIRGLANFRGDILPIIDGPRILQLPEVAMEFIVMVDALLFGKNLSFGLTVSSVYEVVSVSPAQIQKIPETMSGSNDDFYAGVILMNGQTVFICNFEKMLCKLLPSLRTAKASLIER